MISSNRQYPVYLPRGVSDPEGRIGYFSNLKGGINSVNLSTGELIWSRQTDARPLLVIERRLIALHFFQYPANTAEVIILDALQEGKVIFSSQSVVFPEWLDFDQDDFFSVETYLSGEMLVLNWSAQRRYEGGAPPPAYILAQQTKSDYGGFQVNLKTGEVKAERPETKLNQELENFRSPTEEGFVQIYAWRVGDKTIALFWDFSGYKPAIYLKVWESTTNTFSFSKKLLEGEAMVPQITPDGLYILIHSEVPAPNLARENPWFVFFAETGEKMTLLTYESGTRAACIIRHVVFYSVAQQSLSFVKLSIKARDFYSDQVLWEHLLGEERLFSAPPLMQ